ncbi:MAG TPA: GNAT family protein [Caulobacteraceae bacterium]|jgi:RimJ/RimL family protein N-acetyltransferase
MELPFEPMEGRFVRLEPFTEAHREEVRAALGSDENAWMVQGSSAHGEHFASWWETAFEGIQRGARRPYAVRRLADGAVVGTTSYHDVDLKNRGLAVGHTFYAPNVRGGPVNPECKLLMFSQAFAAGALRVELVTDGRNLRSQAAIAKLGAVKEGVLRKRAITWTGHVRDTVVFSITDDEWPAVRAGLEARLQAFR